MLRVYADEGRKNGEQNEKKQNSQAREDVDARIVLAKSGQGMSGQVGSSQALVSRPRDSCSTTSFACAST